jgi:hypothetical protein
MAVITAPEQRGRYFAPRLVALLDANDSDECIDFSLNVNGQDYDSTELARTLKIESGALTVFSQMFRYMALAVAPVSIVAPILQTTVIFRLVFGWLINRNHEVFGASVVLGVVLSTLGVLALTVSVDVVVEHVPLPGWLAEAARLRWP